MWLRTALSLAEFLRQPAVYSVSSVDIIEALRGFTLAPGVPLWLLDKAQAVLRDNPQLVEDEILLASMSPDLP
jgi:hypothetical protein